METIEIELLASKIAEKIQPPGRWMGIMQAAAYSNIGRDNLIRLAKKKKLIGFKDTNLQTQPWVFDRKSIDKFRENQALNGISQHQDDNEKAALDICKAMGL